MEGVDGTVNAMVEFDDGSGPALFVGGDFLTAGGVSAWNIAKWNGTSWSALGNGLVCTRGIPFTSGEAAVFAMTVFDDGSGPALYVGGEFDVAGDVSAHRIARWNGTSWSALGSDMEFNDWVWTLAVHDDGSGPALYAGGFFNYPPTGEPAIAKWDGASWSIVGRHNAEVLALTTFDDGSGPALYAGGTFSLVDGVEASGIAKWDGNTWSAVGPGMLYCFALASFDSGTGPRLYAGDLFGVVHWDGASWSETGSGLAQAAWSLAVFDDGSGPALYAGGDFDTEESIANHLAMWDGSSWSEVGGGTDRSVYALAAADLGSGRSLYVGGAFSRAGATAGRSIARWVDCSPGTVYCFGDGFDSLVSMSCPCGNFGDRRRGCANSNPALGGAELNAVGTKNPNSVVFTCTGIPNGNLCTFLRSAGNNPSGAVFGDGVGCISGQIVRFGQQFSGQGGNEPFTVHAEAATVAAGNTRYYALLYRNPAPEFCPAGAFNVSNGYVIHW